MGHVQHIAYYYDAAFKNHYEPLQMQYNIAEPVPIIGEHWSAILITPALVSRRFFQCDFFSPTYPLYIPELVLRLMALNKRTLQLASFTCESTVAIMEYIIAQRAHWGV